MAPPPKKNQAPQGGAGQAAQLADVPQGISLGLDQNGRGIARSLSELQGYEPIYSGNNEIGLGKEFYTLLKSQLATVVCTPLHSKALFKAIIGADKRKWAIPYFLCMVTYKDTSGVEVFKEVEIDAGKTLAEIALQAQDRLELLLSRRGKKKNGVVVPGYTYHASAEKLA